MSSVVWDGDNLVQRVGDDIEELGHVKFEPASNRYVLWLRDLRGVFGVNDAYRAMSWLVSPRLIEFGASIAYVLPQYFTAIRTPPGR